MAKFKQQKANVEAAAELPPEVEKKFAAQAAAAVVPCYILRADRPGDIERLVALRDAGYAGLEGVLREFELYQG